MGKNLFNKIWDMYNVKTLDNGYTQLLISLHYIHEVTSPQAFQMLREMDMEVLAPYRTIGTVDHIVPTDNTERPFNDPRAEEMIKAVEKNTEKAGIRYYGLDSPHNGIVHVIGPELGLTQPGMTIVCGDSHTSTHGAFGSIAFGIGTSQVRDVLASQSILINKPKVRKISVNGSLKTGISAKDLILKIIKILGVNGGTGYAYEFQGEVFENFDMEERMTVCNMSVEGGARFGYINPDRKTFEYLKGRKYSPADFEKAVLFWESCASDPDAEYENEVSINCSGFEPMVTWGINPGQSAGITEKLPYVKDLPADDQDPAKQAYEYMGFKEGGKMEGVRIDAAFIGSCTNGRISDLREAAKIVEGNKTASHVRALVVPGSKKVQKQAEKEGLDRIFKQAGFEWRLPGCSMCLAMNPDKLEGREICASSSNRNYKGRQGSPAGRTLLMSPAMVAAAAINGGVTDVRRL